MWNVKKVESSNEDVIKFIFTKDDAIAEAVLYRYPTYKDRTVMCVSTQSGCQMGCTFCGTGKFFNRDLTSYEIVEQVIAMSKEMDCHMFEVEKLQIMVMSMGEPLLNIVEVEGAFNWLNENVPNANLLVSTSAPRTKGWDQMMVMAENIPQVGLQFSVHETTDFARDLIMPMKNKLSLLEIGEKGREFYERTGRKPFFNYCTHEGNSTTEDAERLECLFDPSIWECTLSVICEPDETMAHAVEHNLDMINDFSSNLVELGFNTRVFNPAGQDESGGCGQLWEVQKWAEEHPEYMNQSAGDKCRERMEESSRA